MTINYIVQKKLTITVSEQVYNDLYAVAGSRNIGQFIEDLIRPHLSSAEIAKVKLKERIVCLSENEINQINLFIDRMFSGER